MSRPISVAPGLAAPSRIEQTISDPSLPHDLRLVLVIEDGKPVVQALECIRRPDGPPVTPESLRRIPLRRLTRDLLANSAFLLKVEGVPGNVTMTPLDDDDLGRREARQALSPTGRRSLTDDEIRRVALVYRAALASGDYPTKAVASAMQCSRSHAGWLVQQARKRGFLGAAAPGRSGEGAPL